MEQFGIVMSLIGLIFVAIIGVYVWTFKVARDNTKQLSDLAIASTNQLSRLYVIVNSHLQNSAIHPFSDDFVAEKVCTALHEALKDSVEEIKRDVKALLPK